ncbi:class I SAM-dependent DNA methyltransferase [Salaquimonas pukyongi]|uniref:class I SAM-dependent DNA methyltransferase n=1 Tax=Salaquimonas pukyongi TaxID=2712698 RepID=UPI00096B9266|nr:DNA methyltransferase [Salaquimonas pukyongi]
MSADDQLEAFIKRWQENAGGAERANFPLFLTELCEIVGVEKPEPASTDTENNAYVFERAVTFREAGNRTGHGRIDLYKRGSFVLEAKQSVKRASQKKLDNQEDLFRAEDDKGASRRADRKWDVLMMNARRQAEEYAKALPAADGWPPFILVCDVGFCIEVYADFTGQGKNYSQFPDRRGYRIYLDDLRDAKTRERLKAIWEDPKSLDPTARAVKASREIAERLAQVSKSLEAAKHDPEEVAAFLMRCLFTMFAEDMELLPKDSFRDMLKGCEDKPENFAPMVSQLWQAMDKGEFAYGIAAKVRQFNGNLFASSKVFELNQEEIGELRHAADADWTEVDPSIFGTLLEQALSPTDRSKLGAHYTPRAYVERLVIATIMEPLQEDWRNVRNTAERLHSEKRDAEAIKVVREFHEKLFNTRVLDPACGTGNFLYVSLELMKRLEGEVLEALLDLGGQEALRGLERHEVDPHQFLGIELNHRARHIAELVLWIGFLQWHKRNRGELPSDPVLRDYGNIRQGDAVLTWDGYPVPTIKDGKETFPNARRPDWPEAEFIVGNPPFIGKGAMMREALGDDYVEALWKVNKHINKSADFVMYWWDRAAEILTRRGTKLRRFGLVTTNSITQIFNRRILEERLGDKNPISVVMAIPDHPWTKASKDTASVRIAMTVAEDKNSVGQLLKVTNEKALDTDDPEISFRHDFGKIHANLSIGADLTSAVELQANEGMSCNGMMLAGRGFVLSESEANHLRKLDREAAGSVIKPFINGGELVRSWSRRYVIDFFGLDEKEARERFPNAFQHLLTNVKPERDKNRRPAFKKRWWIFGEPRRTFRPALERLQNYIGTTETAKHRVFQFLSTDYLPDHMIIAIGSDDPFVLGVLMSDIHSILWMKASAGSLGVYKGNVRYNKSRCFDPFPFPDPDDKTRAEIGALAEEIDAHRKRAQAEHGVTLTQMYNVLEKLRAGAASHPEPVEGEGAAPMVRQAHHEGGADMHLTPEEHEIHDKALVTTLKHLHDRLDEAVARAYGWPADLSEQEILANLVALNKERAEEEKRGTVRWLRPEYQIPRFGSAAEKAKLEEQIEADLGEQAAPATKTRKPKYPTDELAQTIAVTHVLANAGHSLSIPEIAAHFSQGMKVRKQIISTLLAMARMGELTSHDGNKTVTLKRAA